MMTRVQIMNEVQYALEELRFGSPNSDIAMMLRVKVVVLRDVLGDDLPDSLKSKIDALLD